MTYQVVDGRLASKLLELVSVEPTGTWRQTGIACGKGGCRWFDVESPVYPRSPRADDLTATRLELGLGPIRAASALGIRLEQLEQLDAGALAPASPAQWDLAEEALRARALVDAVAMFRSPPARRCADRDGSALCHLDAAHGGAHAWLHPSRWPLCRWPLGALQRELRDAGLVVRARNDIPADVAASVHSGAPGVPSLIGISPRGRLWAQLFVPRLPRAAARARAA